MKVNFIVNTYSPNTSFMGRDDVRRKTDVFCDELIKEGASGKMPLESVRALAQKHLPEIRIKPLSPKSRKYKDNGGMYHSYIEFYRVPPRAHINKKVLELKIMDDKRDYAEYLATIAHEMTHAFQAADKDLRDDKLITESLQGIPIEQWGDQMDIGYMGFSKIEHEVLTPVILEHKETKFRNYDIHFLDSFVNKERFTKILNRKLKEIEEEHPTANMTFVKKLMYLQAMDEFDAYMVDETFKKKLDKNYKEDDFIPYLYLCLADCLNVKGVE